METLAEKRGNLILESAALVVPVSGVGRA